MKPLIQTVIKILSILLLLLAPSISYSEDEHNQPITSQNTGIESLSPVLRELLKKEMLALQDGMKEIIPAYVSGDWSEIQTIAHKMKNSYILKQQLTDEQVHELHSSLPEAFIKMDQNFHYLSGMLSHVAKEEKVELIGFYYSKLSEACVTCHSQFATHKFPAFSLKQKTNDHQH